MCPESVNPHGRLLEPCVIIARLLRVEADLSDNAFGGLL